MTRNESFKKRIRSRMARTGERYVAARRVLLDQADRRDVPGWASEPEHTDEVIRTRTGRGWDDWVALVEDRPDDVDGHTAVAAWLREEHGVDPWWSQAVTGGWERITGRRLPNQMADGTFTANRSATIAVDAAELRGALLDEDGRDTLFPGREPRLRSRPTSTNIRIGLVDGVAEIAVESRDDGRNTVTVAHAKLASPAQVDHWRSYWGDWLTALDGG